MELKAVMLYIDGLECWVQGKHKPGYWFCPEPSWPVVLICILGSLVWEWFHTYLTVLNSLIWSFLQKLHKESLDPWSPPSFQPTPTGPGEWAGFWAYALCISTGCVVWGSSSFHLVLGVCWLGLFSHCGLTCSRQGSSLYVLLPGSSEL